MKLFNLTLFSLLMGATIAAQAESSLEKKAAKCDDLYENLKEAKVAKYDAIAEFREIGSEAALQKKRAAHKRYDDLNYKYQDLDCINVASQLEAQNKGLSQ